MSFPLVSLVILPDSAVNVYSSHSCSTHHGPISGNVDCVDRWYVGRLVESHLTSADLWPFLPKWWYVTV
jgi:hypothetical protein